MADKKLSLTLCKTTECPPNKNFVKLFDGGGLYLRITKSGKKTWKYDYHIGPKVVTLSLGDFPAVSLSEARNLHKQAQAAVVQGRNPFQEQKDAQAKILAEEKANTVTLENVCLQWF